MGDILHYRGDCTEFDLDEVLGPDLHGAYYRVVSAEYDPVTDRTTRTHRPIPPSELFGG